MTLGCCYFLTHLGLHERLHCDQINAFYELALHVPIEANKYTAFDRFVGSCCTFLDFYGYEVIKNCVPVSCYFSHRSIVTTTFKDGG